MRIVTDRNGRKQMMEQMKGIVPGKDEPIEPSGGKQMISAAFKNGLLLQKKKMICTVGKDLHPLVTRQPRNKHIGDQ